MFGRKSKDEGAVAAKRCEDDEVAEAQSNSGAKFAGFRISLIDTEGESK